MNKWFEDPNQPMRMPPFPLTVLKLHAVGAMLKAGGYRSPANHFSRAKEEHVSQGFHWSDALHFVVRKATMSITRGIAPARQSALINVADVWKLDMPGGSCGGYAIGAPLPPFRESCCKASLLEPVVLED